MPRQSSKQLELALVKKARTKAKKRVLQPRLPRLTEPLDVIVIGWDPGAEMGMVTVSNKALLYAYGGKLEEFPDQFLPDMVAKAKLPVVGVIEEHSPYGVMGDKQYRRLQQRVGMAEQRMRVAGVEHIVRVLPQTWRADMGIKRPAKAKKRGDDLRLLARKLTLELYPQLFVDMSLDVYEAAMLARWGLFDGELGAMLAKRKKAQPTQVAELGNGIVTFKA